MPVSVVVTQWGKDPALGQFIDLLLDMPPGVLSFAFAVLDVLLEIVRCGVSLAEPSVDHEAFAALADYIHCLNVVYETPLIMDLNEVKPRVADYSRMIVEEINGVEVVGGYAICVLPIVNSVDWHLSEGWVPSLPTKHLEGGILVGEEYLHILRLPLLKKLQRISGG